MDDIRDRLLTNSLIWGLATQGPVRRSVVGEVLPFLEYVLSLGVG